MVIWEIRDDCGATISVKPTKGEAIADKRWWKEKGMIVEIAPIKFQPTKAGIAALLDTYAGGAG